MANTDPLDLLFARAKQHRIPMATICQRAGVDPTTPSRWRRGVNGASYEKVMSLSNALNALIAEARPTPVDQAEAA